MSFLTLGAIYKMVLDNKKYKQNKVLDTLLHLLAESSIQLIFCSTCLLNLIHCEIPQPSSH